MYGMITNMWLVKSKGCNCKLFLHSKNFLSKFFHHIKKVSSKTIDNVSYENSSFILYQIIGFILLVATIDNFLRYNSFFAVTKYSNYKCQSIFLSTWNRCTNLSELIFKSRRMRKRLRIDDGCSCSMHEKAVSERKIGCCFVNIFQYDCEHRWSIKTRICKYDGTKILVSWKV